MERPVSASHREFNVYMNQVLWGLFGSISLGNAYQWVSKQLNSALTSHTLQLFQITNKKAALIANCVTASRDFKMF